MTVYTFVMISPSSIGRHVSEANSWTSKTRSMRSVKGEIASHDSLRHFLFLYIMNGLIGHCAIVCAKRSRSRVFLKPLWVSRIPTMFPGCNASYICFLKAFSMLNHSVLYRRASMGAQTKFPDFTAAKPIAMTGGSPGSGGTTYGLFIAMMSY